MDALSARLNGALYKLTKSLYRKVGFPECVIQAVTSHLQTLLPADLDANGAASRFPVDYANSLHGFLLHELARYNALLRVLRGSLEALRQVCHPLFKFRNNAQLAASISRVALIGPN